MQTSVYPESGFQTANHWWPPLTLSAGCALPFKRLLAVYQSDSSVLDVSLLVLFDSVTAFPSVKFAHSLKRSQCDGHYDRQHSGSIQDAANFKRAPPFSVCLCYLCVPWLPVARFRFAVFCCYFSQPFHRMVLLQQKFCRTSWFFGTFMMPFFCLLFLVLCIIVKLP